MSLDDSTRSRRRRARAASSAQWAGLLICCLLGVRLLAGGLADYLVASNPGLALTLAPWNAAARVAQVNLALQDDAPQFGDAIRELRDVVRADPLAPQAYALLAQAYEATGDATAALSAWGWAARASLRDGVAQSVLLERSLKAGQVEAALERLDILLRGDPETGGLLLRRLAPLLTEARFFDALTRRLEAGPPWRLFSLRELARQAPSLDPVLALYRRLLRSAAPPSEDEMRPLLARMVAEGRYEEAYLAWLESGQRDQRAAGEWLYNARFQAAVSNLPFDWIFEPNPGALVQIERSGPRRTLSVDFFGSRQGFQNISQWLMLPPGAYVLSGLELAEGVMSDRGVRWRIACATDLTGALATSQPLTGTVAWREFSASFSVPPNCRAQRLVLEVPARVVLERVISGRVSYAQLSIKARAKSPGNP